MVKLLSADGLHPWKPIPPKKSDPKVLGKKGKVQPGYCVAYICGTSPFFYNWDPDYITFFTESKKLCDPYDCKVIPSIFAGSWEGWEKQVRMVNKMKPRPEAVELNTSCLLMRPEIEGLPPGMSVCNEPEVVERVVKFCVDRLDIPAMPKFNSTETRNVVSAQGVQRAGGAGLNLGDVYPFGLVINIEDATVGEHPDWPTAGFPSWGSNAIPNNCFAIWQMRKAGVTIDIAGTGGVRNFEDMVRYIMAGANSVQTCSLVWIEGFNVAHILLDGLTSFMERKGYKSIDEMCGAIADKVETDGSKFPRQRPLRQGGPPPPYDIVLEERKCIDCGWCEASCMHLAIEIIDGLPKIDKKKCEACCTCVEVCPVRALSMVRVK